MKIVLIFLSMVMLESMAFSAESNIKDCHKVIEVLDTSITEDFYGYIKKTMTDQQILSFYHQLIKGKLINPVPHQKTKMGPVFNHSKELVAYKTIESYLEVSNKIDLIKLEKMVASEIGLRKLVLEKRSDAKVTTQAQLLRLVFFEKFIEVIETSKDNDFIHEIINSDPLYFSDLAKELVANSDYETALKIFAHLNLIEDNLDIFQNDEDFVSNMADAIEIYPQQNILSLVDKILAKSGKDNLSKDLLLSNLHVYYPANEVTEYFQKKYEDERSGLKAVSSIILTKRIPELALKSLKKRMANNKDIGTLSFDLKLKSKELISYAINLLSLPGIDDSFLYDVLVYLEGVQDDRLINALEKLIIYKEELGDNVPFVTPIRIIAKKLLSIQKNSRALSIIKNLIAKQDEKPELILLLGRNEMDVVDIAWPYLNSESKLIRRDAMRVIGQLKSDVVRDKLFNFMKSINDFSDLDAFQGHDWNFILPIVNYFKNREVDRAFFRMLKGQTNFALLDDIKRGLLNKHQQKDAFECLVHYPDDIKIPLIQDFLLSTEAEIEVKAEAIKYLYKRSDPKSLEIFRKGVKGEISGHVFFDRFAIEKYSIESMKSYIYALVVARPDELQDSASFELLDDVFDKMITGL